jgi:hypothetical protein
MYIEMAAILTLSHQITIWLRTLLNSKTIGTFDIALIIIFCFLLPSTILIMRRWLNRTDMIDGLYKALLDRRMEDVERIARKRWLLGRKYHKSLKEFIALMQVT